jgi:hypothetical protein
VPNVKLKISEPEKKCQNPSKITRNYPKSPEIVRNYQRLSEIIRDYQRLSGARFFWRASMLMSPGYASFPETPETPETPKTR